MSANKISFDTVMDRVTTVGNTVLDFQMKRALLAEQRDRVSVADGYYVPGPYDAGYNPVDGGNSSVSGGLGLTIGGVELQPLHLALAGVVLILLVR